MNWGSIYERMKLFWNIVHYFAYRADYRAHRLFNRINPFLLIHKLPFQKRLYERKGIDIYSDMDAAFRNTRDGISILRAGGFMFVLSFLLGVVCFCLAQSIFNQGGYFPGYLMIVFSLPFAWWTFVSVIYKRKYLEYFEQFEKKPVQWRRKWGWISLLTVVVIAALVVASFWWMTYSLHHFGFLKR